VPKKGQCHNNGTLPPDTSIIILTSLIPSHPSLEILNQTFDSLSYLDGIPCNAPIYISVDGLPKRKFTPENIERLHDYVRALRRRFSTYKHVKILNNYMHGHINNNIRWALEVVETKFVYVLQHDFMFIKRINHTGLIEAMKTHPDNLQIIRFSKYKNEGNRIGYLAKECHANDTHISGSSTLWHNQIRFNLRKWSDNNHLTTKAYYEKVLEIIGPVPRAPEHVVMKWKSHVKDNWTNYVKVENVCYFIHQFVINEGQGPYIEHLDGRNVTN